MKHVTWRSKLTFLAVLVAATFLALVGLDPAQAQEDKKTVRLWKAKCASCHGEDGKGATEQGQKMGIGDMTKAEYWKDITDEKFAKVVNDGMKRTKDGKEQEMKPLKDALKPGDIPALRKYSRAFAK